MAARLTAYLVVAIVSATLIAGLMVGAQRDDNDGPVDLIIHNAVVYTADRKGSVAEAVAVRGNQILRVGTDREILRLRRPQTAVIDGGGGAVVPGFNDAYVQLLRGARALSAADLRGAASSTEISARVAGWAAANPDARWIVGYGWPSESFRSSFPARHFLDSIEAARPVVLESADATVYWANSAALRLAGITRDSADPEGGSILKDARGEPSGLLRGSAGATVLGLMPPMTGHERRDALDSAMALANAAGITSVQSLAEPAGALEFLRELRRTGALTLRIYSGIAVDRPLGESDLRGLRALQQRLPDDPLVKAGAVTIRLDGPVAARAAATLQPYLGGTEPRQGATSFSPDDLNRTVRLADAEGWQVVIQANGDRAVRMALDAFAHAARSNGAPSRGRRHRVESIALVDPADLARFGSLGVVASMQPMSFNPTPQRTEALLRHLGPERAARSFPWRTLAGETHLAFGSGWPTFDLNPLAALHVAANRTTPEGIPPGGLAPDERLDPKRAVDAYTSGAAWASFDDQRKGAIAPGMLADLVVLTENIFADTPDAIASTSVAYTVFDGKVVFKRTRDAAPPRQLTSVLP